MPKSVRIGIDRYIITQTDEKEEEAAAVEEVGKKIQRRKPMCQETTQQH